MIYVLCAIVLLAIVFIWHVELLAALIAGWFFMTHISLFAWIKAHPAQIAMYVAGYFVAGAAWSVVKWWFAETKRVQQARNDFSMRHNTHYHNDAETWAEYAQRMKTKPLDHKSDILWWIACWPFSVLWTLIDDPVRRICRRIYDELQGVYQRITNRVWGVK